MEPYIQTVPAYELGESPHWDATKQELLYVNISGQTVHRYVPSTGEHYQVNIPGGEVSPVIPVEGQANRYVIGVGRSLQMMEWDGKSTEPTSLTTMFSVEPDQPANSFNDGKCDNMGRLWVGTANGSDPVANLYRVTNTIQTVQTGVTVSNGIDWNGENTLMYYIDSPTRKVDVYDFNSQQGTISNRRTVYDFDTAGDPGAPDGMTVDANGNLWVACWAGRQILQIDANTGRKMQGIAMPADNITSLTFGGANLDVLYVTSATVGLTDVEKRQQPSAGALFQITNTGARGMRPGQGFIP